jgi:hypothetical protein
MEVAMTRTTAFVAVAVLLVLSLILSMPIFGQRIVEQQVRPAPRWEYKTIRHDLTTETSGDRSELNALGGRGWELCESVQTEGGRPFLILRRPLPDLVREDR